MGYEKTEWVNGGAPGISAPKLNKIEQGIFDAHERADSPMPHLIVNQETGKIYRYGEQISAEGKPQTIFEEVI